MSTETLYLTSRCHMSSTGKTPTMSSLYYNITMHVTYRHADRQTSELKKQLRKLKICTKPVTSLSPAQF